ncbi:MAG: hypothetical protein A2539_00800 [Elusimicrobia bacterium RIFOXYD2_FULL_34_15]|nr:MAG: hypothetical protein A2539_00800 [Elusimicrobia bacterium RIFOXYD2_FULL_34_15]
MKKLILVSILLLSTYFSLTIKLSAAGSEEPDSTVILVHFDEGKGEEVNDSSSYKLLGTLNEADDSNWVEGKVGGALWLNGVDNFIRFEGNDYLNIEKQLRIEFYMKADAEQIQKRILCKSNNSTDGYQIKLNSGRIQFIIYHPDGSNTRIDSSDRVPSGEWAHIKCTYDNTTGKLKVKISDKDSGEVMVDSSKPNPDDRLIAMSGADLYIGYVPNNPSSYYKGVIDELKISNILEDKPVQPKKKASTKKKKKTKKKKAVEAK